MPNTKSYMKYILQCHGCNGPDLVLHRMDVLQDVFDIHVIYSYNKTNEIH